MMKSTEMQRRERLFKKLENRYTQQVAAVDEGDRNPRLMGSFRRTARLINDLGFGHRISEIAEKTINTK